MNDELTIRKSIHYFFYETSRLLIICFTMNYLSCTVAISVTFIIVYFISIHLLIPFNIILYYIKITKDICTLLYLLWYVYQNDARARFCLIIIFNCFVCKQILDVCVRRTYVSMYNITHRLLQQQSRRECTTIEFIIKLHLAEGVQYICTLVETHKFNIHR